VTDRELDALLDDVRRELAIGPSREFAVRVRAGATSGSRRTVAATWVAPGAVAVTAMLVGLWWTGTGPRPEAPSAIVSRAAPQPGEAPGEARALTPRAQAARVPLAAPSTRPTGAAGSATGGAALVAEDPDVAPAAPWALATVEPPAFTLATFDPVDPLSPHITAVEASLPFDPVEFPVVEFPKVEVTMVELPVLPTTPGTSRLNPGKEMP
jgi:hypothetical protein